MNVIVSKPTSIEVFKPNLVASKSIANRVLIIQYLCEQPFVIHNQSEAEDTKALQKALSEYQSESIVDIGHAGTAMRFVTAFLTLKTSKEIIVTSIMSVFGLVTFIYRELKFDYPAVNIRLYKNYNLVMGSIMNLMLGMLLFGTIFIFPLFAQISLGWTATQTGVFMAVFVFH